MADLNQLITVAIALAGFDGRVCNGAALWDAEGGRPCPIGWDDCSQPVFINVATRAYDHGEVGGPGHSWCQTNCPRNVQPPEE